MALSLANLAAASKEPQVTQLANGLTVLAQEDERFPLVSLRLYVRAGSAYETRDQAGVSHLLEHMVFKGVEGGEPGRVAREIEAAGGYVNAATSFDYTVYSADLPAASVGLGVRTLREMAFDPLLDPTALGLEKKVVLSELERGEDDPDSTLFQTLQPLVWPDSPYASPIIGFRETVTDLTAGQIRDYIQQRYQPLSMLLVVCGDVSPAQVLDLAQQSFGGLRSTADVSVPSPLPVGALPAGTRLRVAAGPWNKVYLCAAFPLPGLAAPESAGLETLANILGGGKSSRLYREFKYEKRLVDSIAATTLSLERLGMLHIKAILDPDKLEVFWPQLVERLATLDPADFSDDELARAKLDTESSLLLAKDTLGGLAYKLGFFQFFEHSLGAEADFLYELDAVDRAQLARLKETFLRPERLAAVALTPESSDAGAAAALERRLLASVERLWPARRDANATSATSGRSLSPETVDLGRGCNLVLLPDPNLPYLSINLAMPGGDRLLTKADQGLAELVARSLTKGAGKRNATQIQDFLADRAASFGAQADRLYFRVAARFPSRFFGDMAGLLQDVFHHAAFSPQETANEIENQTAETVETEDGEPIGPWAWPSDTCSPSCSGICPTPCFTWASPKSWPG